MELALEEVRTNGTLEEVLAVLPSDLPAWVAVREEVSQAYNSIEGCLDDDYKITLVRYQRVIKKVDKLPTADPFTPGRKLAGIIEFETVGSTYIDGEWVPFGKGAN